MKLAMKLVTDDSKSSVLTTANKNWTKTHLQLALPSLEAVLVTVLIAAHHAKASAEDEELSADEGQ